jgi:hypothetical protein
LNQVQKSRNRELTALAPRATLQQASTTASQLTPEERSISSTTNAPASELAAIAPGSTS